MTSAHLVVVWRPSTGKVLGYAIFGPNKPDPFLSGKAGSDRMCAVIMSVPADSFHEAMDFILREVETNPLWRVVHESLAGVSIGLGFDDEPECDEETS